MPTNKCPLCKGTGKLERTLNAMMRNQRKTARLSLREAAKIVGVSHTQLHNMENGLADWQPHALNTLQDCYIHRHG